MKGYDQLLCAPWCVQTAAPPQAGKAELWAKIQANQADGGDLSREEEGYLRPVT